MRFEDTQVWKDARVLVADIYRTTRSDALSKDFGLKDQIQRSSVSTMTNIAEGFERRTTPDKNHFYTMARASCGETRSLLYVLLDAGFIKEQTFTELRDQTINIGKQLTGLISALASRRTT